MSYRPGDRVTYHGTLAPTGTEGVVMQSDAGTYRVDVLGLGLVLAGEDDLSPLGVAADAAPVAVPEPEPFVPVVVPVSDTVTPPTYT